MKCIPNSKVTYLARGWYQCINCSTQFTYTIMPDVCRSTPTEVFKSWFPEVKEMDTWFPKSDGREMQKAKDSNLDGNRII